MERPTDAELAEQYRAKAEAQAAKEKAQRKANRAARDTELRAKPQESRAVVKARAQRFQEVARVIERGLRTDDQYRTFHWKGSENHLVQVAEQMGFTLVTESRAKKVGYVLKKGQKPVGVVYYEAPISKDAAVYVLECQFNRAKEE